MKSTAGAGSVRGVTLDTANQRVRSAAAALAEAFRALKTDTTPANATSRASRPAAVSGRAVVVPPSAGRPSTLEATQAVNTQTSTVQSSDAALGLDLSPGAVSTLQSSAALTIDVTSPEADSVLGSAAALGLDVTSADAPSTLSSATALGLDVGSPETASQVSSAALGLDLTSPDAASTLSSSATLGLDVTSPGAASVLKSSGTLGLDVASAQAASTIQSTAEVNTATTSYGSNTLTFTGGGSPSTSVATLSGVYTGVNTAAAATSLTVKLKANTAALNTLVATNVRFEVRDQSNNLLFSFNGSLKAGDTVSLGADIGLSISFSAGSLTNNQTASTTVAHTSTDVDPAAVFNNADPNLRPRFENNAQVTAGSFTVNGTTIAVNANDSINSVIARINASAAGVTASFANDKIRVTTNAYSEDNVVLANDTSGFLSAVKLAAATTTRGNVRDDQQVLAKTSQFASVTSGTFTVNGASISVDKNTDTVSSLVARINSSSAGVTASYDAAQDKLILTTTANTEDVITVAGDTSGFLTAAKLATNNTVRGNIRDDQQVLAKTSQFAGVTTGSFTVNGKTIAVNKDTDTLATVLARINGAGAGVTATYDSTVDKVVLRGTTNSEDLIAVGGDSTGFLGAAHLATANTVRGHLREDTVVFADLARFSSVTSGSFAVDGKTIAVNSGDTIQSIVSKINASGARVSAAFDTATNRLVLTTTYHTEDAVPVGSDTSGFLAAAGIAAGNTVRGNLRDDQQILAKTSQFGGVTSGSFSINGVTIAVGRDTDTLATVVGRINASAAGVTAAYDAGVDRLVLTGTSNSEDLITVGGDTSGFLTAAHLATANTVRGHLPEDTVALANLAPFQSVGTGSFVVDGHTIDVDPSTDTIQSVIAAINQSGARVTASYHSGSDTIVLQTADPSEDVVPIGSDTAGFLAAAHLSAAATVRGNVRDDRQVLSKTGQFGAVSAGSFAINGKTVAIDPTSDTLATIVARINGADAGVTAAFDPATQRLELVGSSFSEDAIAVGDDTSGFLAAARLDAANTVRGNVPDDQQVLSKTATFANVTSGSFALNGVSIAVDAGHDSLQTVITRINDAGTGVTAAYDAVADELVLTPDVAGGPVVLAGDTSGFLSAAGLRPGTFGSHVDPDAAFNASGLDAPFLDPGVTVGAGSFTVNGVRIDVAASDSIRSVLARISTSAAGVAASYDGATQTVKLATTRGTSSPIAVGNDSSGFLAAVKLDASARSTTGASDPTRFDSPLVDIAGYGSVHAGAITVNGRDIAVDPASTTLRGLVSALGGIDGVVAALDESAGTIRLSSTQPGTSITVSDTSGLLSTLGIANGSYRDAGGASKTSQTRIDPATARNAAFVAQRVVAATEDLNAALSQLLDASDASPQVRSHIEKQLQGTVAAFRNAGIGGVHASPGPTSSGVAVDRDALAKALGGLTNPNAVAGTVGSILDGLTRAIGTIAGGARTPRADSAVGPVGPAADAAVFGGSAAGAAAFVQSLLSAGASFRPAASDAAASYVRANRLLDATAPASSASAFRGAPGSSRRWRA